MMEGVEEDEPNTMEVEVTNSISRGCGDHTRETAGRTLNSNIYIFKLFITVDIICTIKESYQDPVRIRSI